MLFGYILIGVILIAFFVNFVSFQGKAQRLLKRYELDATDLTARLKQAQREREKDQALIHSQSHILAEADERIRRMEERLVDLEALGSRIESAAERFRQIGGSELPDVQSQQRGSEDLS